MKIICIEEHITDADVAAGAREALSDMAPYMADIGSRYQEPKDQPRLTFVGDAITLSKKPLADRLRAMDAAGIDHQVVSIGDSAQFLSSADATVRVRDANNRLADAIRLHPRRFSGFFSLPWQDPIAAALEVERCVADLGMPATMLIGRPQAECFIDDPRFAPVFEALERAGTPLYIHPGPPLREVQKPYYSGFDPDVSARLSTFGWGWHSEAGLQVVRLILSGALDRHPRLKLISGHWGEMVPYFLRRLDEAIPPGASGLRRTITQTYRDQVWVTPSGMFYTEHLLFVRKVLGIERIIFSVDYPYLKMDEARPWLEGLPIPEKELRLIAHGNFEAMLS